MAQDREIRIDLDMTRTDHANRVTTARLKIRTSKGYRGGVRTSASVMWVGDGFESFTLFQDFDATLATRMGTATQRNIDECHAFATTPERLAEITTKAKAHYAKEQQREVA